MGIVAGKWIDLHSTILDLDIEYGVDDRTGKNLHSTILDLDLAPVIPSNAIEKYLHSTILDLDAGIYQQNSKRPIFTFHYFRFGL